MDVAGVTYNICNNAPDPYSLRPYDSPFGGVQIVYAKSQVPPVYQRFLPLDDEYSRLRTANACVRTHLLSVTHDHLMNDEMQRRALSSCPTPAAVAYSSRPVPIPCLFASQARNTLSALPYTIHTTTMPNGPTYVEGSLIPTALGLDREMQHHLLFHDTECPEICYRFVRGRVVLSHGPDTGRKFKLALCLARQVYDTWMTLVGATRRLHHRPHLRGVNQRVTKLVTTVDQKDDIIYSQLDDARYDRALLRARVNMLYRDRPFIDSTALLMMRRAQISRVRFGAQSMDTCDQTQF
ncbi:hypothetical protein Tco_0079339 [Tanacetum coccineum]